MYTWHITCTCKHCNYVHVHIICTSTQLHIICTCTHYMYMYILHVHVNIVIMYMYIYVQVHNYTLYVHDICTIIVFTCKHCNVHVIITTCTNTHAYIYRVRHTQLPPIDPSQFDVNKSPQLPRSSDVSTMLYTVTTCTTNNYYYFRLGDV